MGYEIVTLKAIHNRGNSTSPRCPLAVGRTRASAGSLRFLRGVVPVHGARTRHNFARMLGPSWADLSDQAKTDMCAQLKPMIEALQELEQDLFIGEYGSFSHIVD